MNCKNCGGMEWDRSVEYPSFDICASCGFMTDVSHFKGDEYSFLKESNAIEGIYGEEAMRTALEAWDFMKSCEQMNLKNLLTAHGILLKELDPEIAGRLRTVNVRVGNRLCPPWDMVGKLLTSWFMNHAGAKTEDKIIKAHIAFEHVHPYQDGNGRIGRMILNWQRLKNGFPVLIIKADERNEYYKLFH